jgi:hypothetical protein
LYHFIFAFAELCQVLPLMFMLQFCSDLLFPETGYSCKMFNICHITHITYPEFKEFPIFGSPVVSLCDHVASGGGGGR